MSAGPARGARPGPAADAGRRDVVVVGAGPAGATAARELARRGLSVLLVDRQRFPRPKVCGCCLAAGALEELDVAGLGGLAATGGAARLRDLRIGVRGTVRELGLAGGRALSRRRLDAALVAAARDAGAGCRLGVRARPGPAGPDDRRVRLQGEDGDHAVRARVVVAADGVGSPFLRGARELDGAPAGGTAAPPLTVGLGALVVDAEGPGEGVVAMAVGEAGYVGLVSLEDGAVDVAAALRRRRLSGASPAEVVVDILRRSGLGERAGVDPGALREATWSGTPALRRPGVVVTAERVVAIGDAAGYWEPFTGEGIAWALRGGREAAAVVAELVGEWRPERAAAWARRVRARQRRRQRHCRRVAAVMARPRLAGASLAVLERWPGMLSWALPGQRLLSTSRSAWGPGREARA